MKKQRQPASIRRRMFFFFLVPLVLAAVLISAVFMAVSRKVVTDELLKVRRQSLDQLADSVNMRTAQLYSIFILVSEDSEAAKYLSYRPEGAEMGLEMQARQFKLFANRYVLYLGSPYVEFDLLLMNQEGRNFSSLAGRGFDFSVYRETPWYGQAVENGGKIIGGAAFVDEKNREIFEMSLQDCEVIPFYRSLPNYHTGKSRGVFVMNVPHKVLLNAYCLSGQNGQGPSGSLCILNREGSVVSSPRKEQLGQNLAHDERLSEAILCGKPGYGLFADELILYAPVNNGRWVLVERVDLQEYLRPISTMRNVMLFTLLAAAVLAVLVSNYLSGSLSRPISALSGHMSEVRQGNFARDKTVYRVRELLNLRDSFNLMQDNIKSLMERIRREEQSKRILELSVLQAQITPHFLYNSLYSIRCMVAMKNHEEGVRMLDALVGLLHRSVGNTDETTTVEDEIKYLEDYIALRQMGLKKPFFVRIETDREALGQKVPRMLLQPLVENAINHGIRPAAGRTCTLSIEVRLREGKLDFQVSDDGVGMSEEKQLSLLGPRDRGGEDSWNRVGLFNVNERLCLYYGSESLLKIYSEEQVGTTILFTVPASEEKGGEPDAGADSR